MRRDNRVTYNRCWRWRIQAGRIKTEDSTVIVIGDIGMTGATAEEERDKGGWRHFTVQ